jgi:thiazole/oxazole-forming peptide maturase SagD family component
MRIVNVARRSDGVLDPRVNRAVDRCVSPLLGPVRSLKTVNFDASSPAVLTVLPELVELHRRAGVERPDYHLGGFGFRPDEAVMKALGESVERASHFLFHRANAGLLQRASDRGLAAAGFAHVPVREFGHFTEAQYGRPGCPARPIDGDTTITWLPMIDLSTGDEVLLPAQATLAGFPTHDEPRAFVGITTGSAAHVDYPRALLGALLEALQVDVTVGHWYSGATAPRIEVSRTATPRFSRFWEQNRGALERAHGWCEFYWLPQPERLPVYVVACAVRRPGEFPALGIGHGVATDLERAMYRALYEAIPISLVVLLQSLRGLFGDPPPDGGMPKARAASVRELFGKLDIGRVTDLEAGVVHYALPENAEKLFPSRFDPDAVVSPEQIRRDVPPAWSGLPVLDASRQIVQEMVRRFRLYGMDLTTPDITAMGLRVVRVYSPDLMALPIPSFPEAAHPRWPAYGGFRTAAPHPYP